MKVTLSIAFACLVALLASVEIAEATVISAPTEIDGNVLWLDASDTSSISQSSGSVDSWTDKSTAGGGTVTNSGDNRPTTGTATQNGLNLLSFDGADDTLTGNAVLSAGDDTYAYFAVWFPQAEKTQVVFQQTGAGSNERAALLAVGTKYGFCGQYNDAYSIVPYTQRTSRLTAMQVDDTTTPNIRISDNGIWYEGTTSAAGNLNIGTARTNVGSQGSREYFDGEIAEIIVFDRLLSDGSLDPTDNELNDVLYYLDQKWNLGNGISETVPEPSTWVLAIIGLVAIGAYRRRRQR